MPNTINQEKCKKCKLCVDVCPVNIIGINKANQIYFIPERELICLHCGQCMAICTTEAIKIDGLSYKDNLFNLPENKVDYNNFVNFLANRRSVRNFKDKPVSKEIIQKILDALDFAPFGAEPEKINITVINNRKKIESSLPAIENFLNNIIKWVNNPFASFIIKQKKGIETLNTIKNHLYPMIKLKNYKLEYGDRITRGAPAIIIFHAEKGAEEHTNNSLIYATYTMLTAHSLGLGATIIGIVPPAINKTKELKELFQIPEKNEATISVIIGYPKYKYQKTIKRKNHNVNWIE